MRSPLRLFLLGLVLLAAGCSSSDRVNEAGLEVPVMSLPKAMSAFVASNVLTLLDPSEHYQIGPGDVLAIEVMDLQIVDEISQLRLEVRRDGRVRMPLLGFVEAEGKSAEDVIDRILVGILVP